MLKLGYMVPEFPSQTHAFFWREVQALRQLGVIVHIVSTRRPPVGACRHAFLEAAAGETLYLFPPSWIRTLNFLLWHPLRTIAAAHYVLSLNETPWPKRLVLLALLLPAAELCLHTRRTGIDHLHVHSIANSAHVAALSRVLGSCAFSLTVHGDLHVYGTDHLKKAIYAEFVACVTRPLQLEVRRTTGLFPERVPLLWMGVDTSRFTDIGARQPIVGELVILTVARLNRTKGHRFALRALRQVLGAGVRARYVIVGEGPERESIELEVKRLGLTGQVQLIGSRSEDEVLDLLRRADVMVLSSVGAGEAAPVSVMEAMACGLPVVSSVIGGTADMISDGVDGYLVAQEDVPAIADRLVRLARDTALRQSIGRAARSRAVSDFDSGPLAAQLLQLILRNRTPK
jgi:colanic acid/amylovoran biosynthesis glycosyltransferase